jgi:mannose-6-phosphate isomerase-like protein (cupin superfamily)
VPWVQARDQVLASTGQVVASMGSRRYGWPGQRMQRIALDGGCYVIPPDAGSFACRGTWHEAWAVNPELGGEALSMLRVRVTRGRSPIRSFPGSETAVFVTAGHGAVLIGDHRFSIGPHDGIYVAPHEGFAFDNDEDEPLELVMTICPQCAEPTWPQAMPPTFRAAHPERVVSSRKQSRHATADRVYQLMVDERVGCATITQFLGMIPFSRAPEHFHHYEETIAVLSGRGVMWTGDTSTPVEAGSLIYLPRGQKHCLECTEPDGLLIAGMFYPSGSPATRYESPGP